MPQLALKSNQTSFAVHDYDLAATLGCGQAFRWEWRDGRWHGVVGDNAVALEQRGPSRSPSEGEMARVRGRLGRSASAASLGETHSPPLHEPKRRSADWQSAVSPTGSRQTVPTPATPADCQSATQQTASLRYGASRLVQGVILAHTPQPQTDWRWLEDYLQVDVDLPAILATFPQDAPMQQAVARCCGLRLLRQEPWECLASFILSSTKQIVQIQQIIARLCARHGRPIAGSAGETVAFTFPTPERIAALSESELRDCKMGFRAPYLLAAARRVAGGELDLGGLARLEISEARARLFSLAGVGPKIADCVLLFACGFPTAFPVDVWVTRALRQSYFRNRPVPLARLREFSANHFGPHGGYAQQYLFHSLRLEAVPHSAKRGE